MGYCTEQDLIDRFGEAELIQLTDHDGIGQIDAAVLARAIADADGEIDGYLKPKFGAPLATVPLVLVRIACDIARYYLYDDNAPEHIAKRYDDAVKFLKGVARGEFSIGVDAAGAAPAAGSNDVQMESGGRIFGRDDGSFI